LKALELYRTLPAGVRFHTRMRSFTCPMHAIAARLPGTGSLLDVGCGHGLFANEAALLHPGLHVLGIDPSPEKIRWAAATAADRTRVRFRAARLDDVGEGSFDALSLLDVLYLVPRGEWASFLSGCRERLRPGGALLLKDVDVQPRWKFRKCVLQEAVSVRLLGITLGRSFSFASKEEMAGFIADAGFSVVKVTDLGRGYTTPHVLYEAVRS